MKSKLKVSKAAKSGAEQNLCPVISRSLKKSSGQRGKEGSTLKERGKEEFIREGAGQELDT